MTAIAVARGPLQDLPDIAEQHLAPFSARRNVRCENLEAGITGRDRVRDLIQNLGFDGPQQHDVKGPVGMTIPLPVLLPLVDRLLRILPAVQGAKSIMVVVRRTARRG